MTLLTPESLTDKDLESLSLTWLIQFEQIVIMGMQDEMHEALAQLGSEQVKLIQFLQKFVDNFEFQELLDWIDRHKSKQLSL